MLTEAEKQYHEQGTAVWLVGLNPHVLAMIQRSNLGETLGHDAMHFNLEIAVAKYVGSSATTGR